MAPNRCLSDFKVFFGVIKSSQSAAGVIWSRISSILSRFEAMEEAEMPAKSVSRQPQDCAKTAQDRPKTAQS